MSLLFFRNQRAGRFASWWAALVILWVAVLSPACDEEEDTGSGAVVLTEPTIEGFSADPEEITRGARSTLRWTVKDANTVSIFSVMDEQETLEQVFTGATAESGSLAVSPAETTLYRLVALNVDDSGNASQAADAEATVTVLAPPNRPSLTLTLDPLTIVRGESATLSWQSADAEALTLTANGAPLALPEGAVAEGSLEVSPTENTDYEMIARGPGGESSQQVALAVREPAVVVSFTASPGAVAAGGEVALTWETQGATRIELRDAEGALDVAGKAPQRDSLAVTVAAPTTWTLTAFGEGSQGSAEASVTILPAPQITRWEAVPAQVTRGEDSATRLFYATTNADAIQLLSDGQDLTPEGMDPAQGEIIITPAADGEFLLVATGPGGRAEATTTVTVVDPVEIVRFTATPVEVIVGEPVTLGWTLRGATALTIIDEQGEAVEAEFALEGSVEITPAASGEYTLTATGPGGEASATVSVTVDEMVRVSLTLEPEVIDEGGSATLSWQSIAAERLELFAEPGPTPDISAQAVASGSVTVSPAQTTRYTLTAFGPRGQAQQEATLVVNPAVEIVSFEIQPQTVFVGEGASVTWETRHASTVRLTINGDAQEVAASGAMELTDLQADATVTLTAEGVGGPLERTQAITVTDVPIPVILTFQASPEEVTLGQPTTALSWTSQRADALALVALVEGEAPRTISLDGQPLAGGQVTDSPLVTTRYRLTATNQYGDTAREATVAVPLEILSFEADVAAIRPGDEVALSWQVQGARRVSVTVNEQNLREVSVGAMGRGALTLALNPGDVVRLTAAGPDGALVTRAVTLGGLPPEILSFVATPSALDAEVEQTGLTWETTPDVVDLSLTMTPEGGEEAERPLSGQERLQGALTERPARTTTYVLTARNPFGEDSAQVTVSVELAIDNLAILPEAAVLYGLQPTLLWDTRGAARAELILNEDAPFPAMLGADGEGSFVLGGRASAEATLVAYDGGERSVSRSVSLTLLAPVISALSASPDILGAGRSESTISAQAQGVESLILYEGEDAISTVSCAQTPLGCDLVETVTPTVTTTYTLEAIHPEETTTQTVTVTVPVSVVTFSASPSEVAPGGTSTLTWQAQGASVAELQLNEGRFFTVGLDGRGRGSYVVEDITQTTSATLIVRHGDDTASAEVTISLRPPSIEEFSASAEAVGIDDNVSLFWQTTAAETLTLTAQPQGEEPFEVNISGQGVDMGFVSLRPRVTTRFTLTASNAEGEATRSLTVVVPLEILSLEVSPSPLIFGQPAQIRWRVQGAQSGSLQLGDAQIIAEIDDEGYGGYDVEAVDGPIFATLFVEDVQQQTDEEQRAVELAPPRILSFFSDPTSVDSGQEVTLRWTTEGAEFVEVFGFNIREQSVDVAFDGPAPTNGAARVVVDFDTFWTLVAYNPAGEAEAEAQTTATNVPTPAEIISFEATPPLIFPGENAQVLWRTANTVTLVLQELDESGEVLFEDTIDPLEHAGGSRTYFEVGETLRFRLVAVGPDQQEVTAEAQVEVRGDPAQVKLSEVYYDSPGNDTGREWVELYNPGPGAVDLAALSLGHGGGSFTNALFQLPSLVVPAGGCVVLGGPDSIPESHNPRYDLAFDFNPDIQNSGAIADGVALFVGTPEDVLSEEVAIPSDAVTYGGEIGQEDSFWTTEGFFYEFPDVGDAPNNQSIAQALGQERFFPVGDIIIPNNGGGIWFINPTPTPGACFGLNPDDGQIVEGIDAQVFFGRRQGPEAGGNLVGLAGFNLNEDVLVTFGGNGADCVAEGPGLLCAVPPGSGRVDLTLTSRVNGAQVNYPQWYGYESIDYCNLQFPTEILDAPGVELTTYGRVYEAGVTEDEGSSPALQVQWGYGPQGIDPVSAEALDPAFFAARWSFFDATYNIQIGNDDEYQVNTFTPAEGDYSHYFRVRRFGEEVWTWCDANGTINNDPRAENVFDINDAGVMFIFQIPQ
jgi:hypothetical protein